MACPAPDRAGARAEILVVGDVHGDWDLHDQAFVEGAGADLVVFVGDFGEEDVAMVARIAAVACPKAVLLGNHDAWWSMSGRDTARVEQQIELLGEDFLAWSGRSLCGGRIGVVAGKPFSWGGGWGRNRAIYHELFGIPDAETSTARIVAAADRFPDATLVLVGHNGPRGLGEGADAIFGCDFRAPHVDWGDADLGHALRRLAEGGRRIVATAAGHMHDRLCLGGFRRRVVVRDGTVHLNAAVVPRHRPDRLGRGRLRHFLRLVVSETEVETAEDLWVGDDRRVAERRTLHAGAGAPVSAG